MINERRIVVTFADYDKGGEQTVFEDLKIAIKGNRTGSFVTNSAKVSITNIRKEVRDQLTTKYRPVENLKRGLEERRGWIYIDIGRKEDQNGQGAELFRLFEGGVISITQSEPPDITLTFDIVANFRERSAIDSFAFGNNLRLSALTGRVADILGLAHNYFGEKDPALPTMNYSGDVWGLIEMLDGIQGYSATVDNGMLTVYPVDGYGGDTLTPLLINKDTGMVGSPQPTDSGISFTVMARGDIKVGTWVTTKSVIAPATNGTWKIIAINFEIANRDNPFYYHCKAVASI